MERSSIVSIKIRPDLESCDKIPAKRISVSMLDPLAHLISTIPPMESLPYFESRTDAGISMMRQVKAKLIETPQLGIEGNLDEIATPIAHKMKLPTLVEKMESCVPLTLSMYLTIIVFIGNWCLHLLVMYIIANFLTPQVGQNDTHESEYSVTIQSGNSNQRTLNDEGLRPLAESFVPILLQ